MTQPDASEIVVGNGGTTFKGADSVKLFSAMSLKSALSLYARSKMKMTRSISPSQMLKSATAITQKNYKRGEYAVAAEDLRVWCETMKTALPITEGKS